MPGPSPQLTTGSATTVGPAFLLGSREWFILALVTLLLFGRATVTGTGRIVGRLSARPRSSRRPTSVGSRWVVAHWSQILLALAGLIVIAWTVLTWSIVHSRPGS